MESDVQTGVSSTPAPSATDQAVSTGDVSAYRDARRAERVGTPLPTPSADPSPAQPVEQVASADASQAASEAAAPAKPRTDPRATENRLPVLLEKNARLREENERLHQQLQTRERPAPVDAKPAASSPAPPTFPSFEAYQAQHPDASYETYLDARADFRADQRQQVREAEQRRSELTQEQQTRAKEFHARMSDATKADPEFIAKIDPRVMALKPTTQLGRDEHRTALSDLAEELVTSPVAPQLLRHFTDHPEELERFSAFPSKAVLLRAFGALEASLERAADAPPPPTPITRAPPPVTTLGSRTTTSESELDSAVAEGDVGRFRAARLRERTANLR